jgi:hypothetical protein
MLPLTTANNHNNPDDEDAAMNHAMKQKEVKNLACSIIENQMAEMRTPLRNHKNTDMMDKPRYCLLVRYSFISGSLTGCLGRNNILTK